MNFAGTKTNHGSGAKAVEDGKRSREVWRGDLPEQPKHVHQALSHAHLSLFPGADLRGERQMDLTHTGMK